MLELRGVKLPSTCDYLICRSLGLADLARCSSVSQDARRMVSDYANVAFKFHHCLAKFMTEGEAGELRAVMKRTGTIISGSVALQFFTREPIPGCDLDLYTNRFFAMDVFSFIVGLGYTWTPRPVQSRSMDVALARAIKRERIHDSFIYNKEAILDVFSFEKVTAKGPVIIQVMVVVHSPIDAVLEFHSTIVMNAITHRAAYALYPFNTFGSRFGVCFDSNTFDGPSHKYRRRGYDVRSVVEDTTFPGLGEEVTRGDRYVGDKHTWVVNFDAETGGDLDPFMFNSWSLQWSQLTYVRACPRMVRYFYVSNNDYIARVFASKPLLDDFTDRATSINPDKAARTDAQVLQAVIRSGQHTIFAAMPPSAADANFMGNVDKAPVHCIGVHQLALRSVGPTALLGCAFEERGPNDADEDDDIICTGISFGRCLGRRNYGVKENRILATMALTANPSGSSQAQASSERPAKRRRIGV